MDSLIPPVTVPEGSLGAWTITRREVEDSPIMRIRERHFRPGVYTFLHRGGALVMSDTPAERFDHMEFVHRATGRVLISGLGLGMCVGAVLRKPDVKSVTVIEIDEDLIELVGPHYDDPRVEIIQADAMKYKPEPGSRFDAVWHDIWNTISDDNRGEMSLLNRRWGQFSVWTDCWSRGLLGRRRA